MCKIIKTNTIIPLQLKNTFKTYKKKTENNNKTKQTKKTNNNKTFSEFYFFKYSFISGVTILLSLTVFLNLVAETLPQVSDAIPLLGREIAYLYTFKQKKKRKTTKPKERFQIYYTHFSG